TADRKHLIYCRSGAVTRACVWQTSMSCPPVCTTAKVAVQAGEPLFECRPIGKSLVERGGRRIDFLVGRRIDRDNSHVAQVVRVHCPCIAIHGSPLTLYCTGNDMRVAGRWNARYPSDRLIIEIVWVDPIIPVFRFPFSLCIGGNNMRVLS